MAVTLSNAHTSLVGAFRRTSATRQKRPSDTDVSYLLTSGGHNAGIISEPGHLHHSYQMMTRRASDRYIDPDIFQGETPSKSGSWWPEWSNWLKNHSGEPIPPPAIRIPGQPPLCAAPGTYVLQE